jgi:serine/threonine-protein kinase
MSSPVAEGTVLAGKYRVDRILGEGGMGVVVAATDIQLERRVAIKFLLPDYAKHHEATERFLREARAAVKIQSEHVARVIDVGTMESGAPYMVMEYLEGRDLAALIDDRRQIPVEEAIAYVLEACDAIAEAHSVGIVHRDLKPANLFLTKQPDGSVRIKVLDFGISKALMTAGTGIDPSLTRTSSMMGSPLYMSPEQMKSAKNVDPRTDVWALGVIAYELLTGEPPFYAESIPELSAKVLLEEPKPIRSYRPDVPEALEAVVKHALAKDTAARFSTVADLAGALSSFGPARTRANVERAARVLKVSGMSSATSQPGSLPAATAGAYARTAAAWTDSAGGGAAPRQRGKLSGPMIGGAIALGVALLGGVVFALSSRTPAPASPAAAVAPAPVAAPAAPAPAPAKPVDEPTPAASAQIPDPAVAPNVGAPAPALLAPAAASPAAAKASVAAHSRPTAKAKPAAAPVPAGSPDPNSGFGSRK